MAGLVDVPAKSLDQDSLNISTYAEVLSFLMDKLKLFTGEEHPHEAQKPEPLEI